MTWPVKFAFYSIAVGDILLAATLTEWHWVIASVFIAGCLTFPLEPRR